MVYDKRMKRVWWGIFICSLLFNFVFLVQNYNRTRVVAVPDGDSIQLSDGRRVRLLGIDAPEKGRCMADEAREKLKSLIFGKHVRLKDTVTDDYGRVLAIVIVEDFPTWISYLTKKTDPLVNRVMLASGLAKNTFSASTDYAPTLKKASDLAKARNIGIYTCRTQPTGDCTIKGNVRDGEKKYYLSECQSYRQVIVDEAYGDHWFCTEAEAIAAGFTKAAGCRK
jgi:endonuclease YncB( thermonuclease family)